MERGGDDVNKSPADLVIDGQDPHLAAEAARAYPTPAEAQYPLAPSVVEAGIYTDPALYRREIEAIFHRSWYPACPSGDLANARDYVVWDRLQQSIVLARLNDGSVAAWHNVCQHRGARLLKRSGHCPANRLACPWHGLQYDLTGEVKLVPLRKAFDEARLDGLRAPAVRVEEWGGFVWICLSDDVPPLKAWLGDVGEELSWYGLDRFENRFRFEMEVSANWKMVVDAFNETWHVPFTHKDTLGKLVLWRDAHLRITPPHSWMTLPVAGFTDRAGDVDHRQKYICHYLSFPNTIFSCFPTHLQTWNVWPLDVGRTLITAWGMVGPAPEGIGEEQWQRQNQRDWDHFVAVSAEDAEVLNDWSSVSHSLGARQYMFNAAEGRLTAFHQEVARRVAEFGAP